MLRAGMLLAKALPVPQTSPHCNVQEATDYSLHLYSSSDDGFFLHIFGLIFFFHDFQIQQLVDMGFNRGAVTQALRATDNDIAMATNLLLQE